jgi:hypothetical protein
MAVKQGGTGGGAGGGKGRGEWAQGEGRGGGRYRHTHTQQRSYDYQTNVEEPQHICQSTHPPRGPGGSARFFIFFKIKKTLNIFVKLGIHHVLRGVLPDFLFFNLFFVKVGSDHVVRGDLQEFLKIQD